MGRFYHGDISGKFWFGIQSSDDACNLGGHLELVYRYHVCGCEYDYKRGPKTTPQTTPLREYCMDCYHSYEEHVQALLETMENTIEGGENGKDEPLWYLVENEIHFLFQEGIHLSCLEENMNQLQEKVGKYIQSFLFLENTDTFEYDITFSPLFHQEFDGKKQETRETQELIARLCLAKQIFYCLKTHGFCSFYAET